MVDKKLRKGSWYILITKGYAVYKGKFNERQKVLMPTTSLHYYNFSNAKRYNKRKKEWYKTTYSLTLDIYKIWKIVKVKGGDSDIPANIWTC